MKIFILLLITSIFLSESIAQTVSGYLETGDDFYKKFDLINAAENYENAVKLEPNNFYALLKTTRIFNDLGEDYYEKRDEINAEKAVNNAVKYAELFEEKYPDSAKVYALLAMSYGNLALYRGGTEKIKLAHKIKENAEKSIKMDPNDYLPYIILSIYNRQIASLNWFERAFANTFFGDVPDGSFEDAEKLMIKALSIQPGILTAMFHLSLVYRETDKTDKEIYWLKKISESPIVDFRDKYTKKKAKERLKDLLD